MNSNENATEPTDLDNNHFDDGVENLTEDYPGQRIEGPEVEPVAPARSLDFTVVAGYLRGDHRCPFELHATGCRDLNKLKTLGLFSFNVYAESREAAHIAAVDELGGVAKLTDIWVQPCCTLKRMQAIGRA